MLQVMIGTKFEEEKKKKKKPTMNLLFIIIKYVMFISHAAKKNP